jgi:CHAT domain-containing protein
MFNKRGEFWRFFRRRRYALQAAAKRSQLPLIVSVVVVLFLLTTILPVGARNQSAQNYLFPLVGSVSVSSSLAQAVPNADALAEQGRTLYTAQRYNEAVKILQKAVTAYAGSGDKLRQAMTLSNLALTFLELGAWQDAAGAIAQSLNLLQNLPPSPEPAQILAQTLDVQGRLQSSRGQTEAAVNTWQTAADIYQQLDEQSAFIRNRINSAGALQALGLYRQSQKMLTQVRKTLTNQPDTSMKAAGLRSLGDILRLVGDLKQSHQVLQESLKVASSLRSNQAMAEAYLSLGNTSRAQGDTQAASKFYQQAASASPAPNTRIQLLLNQFGLFVATKQYDAAAALAPQITSEISNLPASRMAVYAQINYAQNLGRLKQNHNGKSPSWLDIAQSLAQAAKLAQNLQDKRAESYATGTLGWVYEQAGQLPQAKNLTEKALFAAGVINASDIAYQWQWQMGRLWRAEGNIKAAITAYEQAFQTLKSLRNDLAAISPDVQFSFTESVEPVYRELVDLLLQFLGDDKSNQDNLKKARNVIESLQLAELDNFFRSACLTPTVNIDEIIEQYQKTAIIYPIILPDRLEIILKLPNQDLRRYRTVIIQDKVESTLNDLRTYLLDVTRTAQVKQQSQQVYDWLIRPAENDLASSGVTTLVFVLDGSLRNIPMAVLYDNQKQKYLLEKYAIALTPGLQLLDPKPLQKVQLNALTAGVGEERAIEGREFPPLENVPRELKEIQTEVAVSEELLNQEFTKTKLQNQLQSAPFSVVHLATHGKFSSNPDETFILTWDTLLKVQEFDTLVRVSDQNQSKNIELLVLSACKTAEGDKRAALGLAGVAVRAGARSTLATLWSVDDKSTADLMSEFYRQLNTGITKAEAIQRAQLAVFAEEKRPYFWGPYVLVGNWL